MRVCVNRVAVFMALKAAPKDPSSSSNSAPPAVLGRVPDLGDRVKIWWPDDGAFYSGKVTRFNDQDNTHFIEYDDGETEFLDMKNERWLKIGLETESDNQKVNPKPENIPANLSQSSNPSHKSPQSSPPEVPSASTAVTAPTTAVPITQSLGAAAAAATTTPTEHASKNWSNPTESASKSTGVPPKKSVNVVPEKKVPDSAHKIEPKPQEPISNQVNQPPQSASQTPVVNAANTAGVPRYKLQPRHANGKFGALPPELKVGAQRSKTADSAGTATVSGNSGRNPVITGRSAGQTTTAGAAGNRSVVSGPHVTRRPGTYDPVAGQGAAFTGNTAVKRHAPLPAGRPLIAPTKSAVGIGHSADAPKKKMRMSAPPAQVARGVTAVRMPGVGSAPTPPVANQPKSRPVNQRVIPPARPNQRLAKTAPMSGLTKPGGGIPESGISQEEMYLDNKNELQKVQRSVTLLHSMLRDMQKQTSVEKVENRRLHNHTSNDLERLRMDIRRLLDGQNDIMIALGNLQERAGGGSGGNYPIPSNRQPYQPPQYRAQWRGGGYPPREFYDPSGRYAADAGWDRGHERPMATHPGRRISSDRVPQSESIVHQVKGDILALTAKQVMIWLLETDHECRTGDLATWAQVETTKCMERVAYLLGKFTEYAQALRVLTDSLGLDSGQLLWFTDTTSAENLQMARRNYDVWDPPPTDHEWVKEVKLLVEVEKRFKIALGKYEISVNETTLAACISVANAAAAAMPIVRTSNGPKGAVKPPNGGQPVQETAAEIVAMAGSVQQPPPPSVQQQPVPTVQQANEVAGEGNTVMIGGSSMAAMQVEPGFAATPNPNGGAM